MVFLPITPIMVPILPIIWHMSIMPIAPDFPPLIWLMPLALLVGGDAAIEVMGTNKNKLMTA